MGQTSIKPWVKGNTLPLAVPLRTKTAVNGQWVTEDYFPPVGSEIHASLVGKYKRYEYDFTIVDNVVKFTDDGLLPIGDYGVEVTVQEPTELNRRTFKCQQIRIVNCTDELGMLPDGEVVLDAAVFISYGVEQVQSDWAETDPEEKSFIKNKPDLSVYATKEELSEVESEIPTLPDHIVTDEHYVHTDNNYTTQDKQKLAGLENYDDSGIRQKLDGKVDKVAGKVLSTNDYTNEDKQKVDSALQSETDPTVPQWAKQPNKPSYTSQEVGALPNSTKYGSTIDLAMDSATYVLTLSLKDQDGTVLNTKTVDLPIESVVVNGRYDAANKKIVLTLQSGSTIDVPVGDLIAGLQTEITSVSMLDADLVDDTNSTHKFVTAQEKTTWNNKSDFSGSYNDLTDKPTIPTALSQLSEDTTHRTVSDTEKTTWGNKQEPLVSGTNIKTINNESVLGSGNISVAAELPSNLAYTSDDDGEGIIPSDGIRAVTVTSAAAMTINPDVVTVINGAVGTAAITLQVPQDNLAHVWDILMTTDSTVAITFAMSNSATILYPSGFSVGASKAVEVSVIGVGTKYYLRYGEFA